MSEQIKLPYLFNPKKTEVYFEKIKQVEVPSPKFTYDFLENVCLLKSHADRAIIPLLKKMGLLEQDGRPTALYSDFRNGIDSKKILAIGTKKAFAELFRRNVNLHNLDEEQIKGYVKSVTGLGEESSTLPLITKTVTNLIALGDYSETTESETPTTEDLDIEEKFSDETDKQASIISPIKLNYTISINLPESKDEEVYEKIFNSIKKTLMTN